MLKLDITHELAPSRIWAEIRFDSEAKLDEIKAKVSRHVGSQEEYIKLQLRLNAKDIQGTWLEDPYKTLKQYGAESGMVLHVYDSDPNSFVATMDDIQGPRFKMSDEAYAKRPCNAREFLTKLRKQRPDLFEKKAASEPIDLNSLKSVMPIGSRCQLGETIRGNVAWVGIPSEGLKAKLSLKDDIKVFVGIKLDEPLGNTDGSEVDGSFLFEVGGPRGGLIVPYEDVKIGDFPPLDPFELDEI